MRLDNFINLILQGTGGIKCFTTIIWVQGSLRIRAPLSALSLGWEPAWLSPCTRVVPGNLAWMLFLDQHYVLL